jgi:hypothetical protein
VWRADAQGASGETVGFDGAAPMVDVDGSGREVHVALRLDSEDLARIVAGR